MSHVDIDAVEQDLGVSNEGEPEKVVIADVAEPETAVVEQEETEEQPEKRKGGYQRKIDRLERQLEQAIAALSTNRPAPAAEPIPEPVAPGRPKAEDFDSHEEWVDALTDYKIDQRESKMQAKREAETKAAEQSKQQNTFQSKFQQAKTAHPDFEELFEDNADQTPSSPSMNQAVIESDHGHELMYFFLKNPDEAKRIALLPPSAAFREIGKLETRFEAKATTTVKPSSAPKPPTPVKASPGTPPADSGKYLTY